MFKLFLLVLIVLPSSVFADCKEMISKQLPVYLEHLATHYPDIVVARNRSVDAKLELNKALSAFDPNFRSTSSTFLDSFYTGSFNEVALKKQNNFLGSNVELGYRNGAGSFSISEDGLETSSGGEFFTTLTIPLLRNLQTDSLRLNVSLAEQNIDLAHLNVLQSYLSVIDDFLLNLTIAQKSNYDFGVTSSLIKNLEEQLRITKKQVELGTTARNDILESERFILKAKSKNLKNKNIINQTLNYINQVFFNGTELEIEQCQLPKNIVMSDQRAELDSYLKLAVESRPDLKILKNVKGQIKERINFRKNELLPNLNLRFEYEDGVGAGDVSDTEQSLKALIALEVPIFNRAAKANLGQKELDLENLNQQILNLENKVQSRIFSLVTELNLSREQFSLVTKELNLSEKLLAADYESYKSGNKDLFQINQRQNILLQLNLEASDFFFTALTKNLKLLIFSNQSEEIEQVYGTFFKDK